MKVLSTADKANPLPASAFSYWSYNLCRYLILLPDIFFPILTIRTYISVLKWLHSKNVKCNIIKNIWRPAVIPQTKTFIMYHFSSIVWCIVVKYPSYSYHHSTIIDYLYVWFYKAFNNILSTSHKSCIK